MPKTSKASPDRRLTEYFCVVSTIFSPPNTSSTSPTLPGSTQEPVPQASPAIATIPLPTPPPLSSGPAPSLSHLFTPSLTSRYPLVDHVDNPLPPAPSLTPFCYPSSLTPQYDYTLPKCHYFVLTSEHGLRNYATCLTLYEPFTVQFIPSTSLTDGAVTHVSSADPTSWDPSSTIGVEASPPPPLPPPTVIYIPKSLLLISLHPFLPAFRSYLTQLYRISTTPTPIPLERYIKNITQEVPYPPHGIVEVQLTILDTIIKFWSPPANQPLAYVSLPLKTLFEYLPPKAIITVWHALTLERQVLFTSSSKSLLILVSEIFLSLLFPLSWTHCYIPLLPTFLFPVLSAPMPYLCGVLKPDLPTALMELSPECIIVDLDTSTITFGGETPPLPPLPARRKAKLERALTTHAPNTYQEYLRYPQNESKLSDMINSHDEAFSIAPSPENMDDEEDDDLSPQTNHDAIQEAFLRFYVAVLLNYRKFLMFPTENNPLNCGFQTTPFLDSQKSEFQKFLKQLTATQMFDSFITKRLYSPGLDDVTFFDESIDAKFNRYKMRVVKIETPFLQSAKVRRKLKTVVAPEPGIKDLPANLPQISISPSSSTATASSAGSTLSKKKRLSKLFRKKQRSPDESLSSSSSSPAAASPLSSSLPSPPSTPPLSAAPEPAQIFCYSNFPSTLSPSLFGTPKPLPTVIEAETTSKENTARLRNHSNPAEKNPSFSSAYFASSSSPAPATLPSSATFTVFFISYTAVVGKDLKNLQDAPDHPDSAPPLPRFNRLSTNDSDDSDDSASSFVTAASVASSDSPHAMRRLKSSREEFLEETKATAKAQLDLAFDILTMMRNRKLTPESYAYQCLIEACGRCGDTDRVCELLGMMHEDGVVADSIVYSCLVKAFSNKKDTSNKTPLPSYANGYSGAIDWNKMRPSSKTQTTPKRSSGKFLSTFFNSTADKLKAEDPDEFATDTIIRQNELGNSLLELLYKEVEVDVNKALCNGCEKSLTEKEINKGWNLGDAHDYCIECPKCGHKGVCRFSVKSANTDWKSSGIGGKHEGLLYCEFLSPWVLRKEIMNILSEKKGINTLLDPDFPNISAQKSCIFWNLIVSLKRERLPFTFLFQGSFGNSLITPTPDGLGE